MVRIRRFGIVRTANMAAALYAFISLIFVGLFGLFALLGVAVAPNGSAGTVGAGVLGLVIVGLVVVLVYAVVGWVFTAIACALYNVVAGWVGGIEVQVETTTPMGPGGGYPAYGYPTYPAPGGYPAPYGYPAPGQTGPAPAPWGGGSMPPPAPGR